MSVTMERGGLCDKRSELMVERKDVQRSLNTLVGIRKGGSDIKFK